MAEQIIQETAGKAIPAGYKQTEVGVIPEDWDVFLIDNCAVKVGSGKTPTGGSSVYVDSGRPFVRSQNVGWGKLDLSDVAYITETVHSTFLGSEIKRDDVLLNITGASIGRCAKADVQVIGGNVNQHVCIIRVDGSKFVPVVLVELINSSVGQNQIDSFQAGGNREGLNFAQVRQLKFALPLTVVEQTAIANVLSDSDALIDALEQLIAKKQAIKSATMQQLLTGRTRLPAFALRPDGTKKGYKPSELGDIPEDWEVETIGNVCDLLTGYPFPSNKYSDSGIRLLRGSNVKRGVTDWSPDITQYWPLLSQEIKQYELLVGDVVISMDGSLVGRSFAQLTEDDLPAVLLQRVARIRSVQVSQYFLKEWICSPFFTEHCDSVKTVTAIPHISPQDIRDFKLLLPPTMQEQTAIATILSDMDNELQALTQKLEKARAQGESVNILLN
ncbi:restriction endonuclease subunit S [Aeromonas veronii]